VRYVKDRADVAAAVADLVGPGDLLLTMGAGDLTSLADELREGSP
jgi:UDP-N-acetylmuramate--alanine ligase